MHKHKLLDEVFSIGGNHNLERYDELVASLLDYLKINGADSQICDALSILEASRIESEQNDFESGYEVTAPIFKRLTHVDAWDFYDIKILATVIDYAETFEQMHMLVQVALEKLEKYSDEKKYISTKVCIHTNALRRLVRARYYDLEDMSNRDDLKTLEDTFMSYYDTIMALCEVEDFPIHKMVVPLRKGIFFNDADQIAEGFAALKYAHEDEVYRLLEDEVEEFLERSQYYLSHKQRNAIIGRNIQRERAICRMSVETLAEILGFPPHIVRLVEGGQISASNISILRMAKAFNVSNDVFYEGISVNEVSVARTKKRQKIEKLDSIAKKLSVQEIEHLTMVAESLIKMKN